MLYITTTVCIVFSFPAHLEVFFDMIWLLMFYIKFISREAGMNCILNSCGPWTTLSLSLCSRCRHSVQLMPLPSIHSSNTQDVAASPWRVPAASDAAAHDLHVLGALLACTSFSDSQWMKNNDLFPYGMCIYRTISWQNLPRFDLTCFVI
jgi:hypothetical protein